ncbi:MAG: hypothetical protein ChlgKO_11120 [Chlamydiales bacterium]
MSTCTVVLKGYEPKVFQKTLHMTMNNKSELYSIFETVANSVNAYDLVNSSSYLSGQSVAVLSSFFSITFQQNFEKLADFSNNEKAHILYNNYRNRIIEKISTQDDYENTLINIQKTFSDVEFNVKPALNFYLMCHFDNFHSNSSKRALTSLFQLDNLNLQVDKKVSDFSDQFRIEILDDTLNSLWQQKV